MQDLILNKETTEQTIIFAATRYHVEFLYEITNAAGFAVTYIFGAMD